MSTNLTVSVIQKTTAFHDLKEDWNCLLEDSRSNTIFLRWEWLYNWWLIYKNQKRSLYLVMAKENGRLLGIAPLYLETKFAGLIKEIKFLGTNIICSDYLDFILLKGREKETLRSILTLLLESNQRWAKISLTDIPENSITIDIINSYVGKGTISINEHSVCPYIDLNGRWDNIFNSFSSKIRNTISRKLKKFSALPENDFIKVLPDDLDDFYLEFVCLNRMRMKMMKRSSPFEDQNFFLFHKRLLQELVKKELAALYFLKAADQIIAAIYILSYNEKYHFYQSGFSPEWAKLSPGNLLFYFCIKEAHEQGITEFDFLRGEEEYKGFWTKMQRKNMAVNIFNTGTVAAVLRSTENRWRQLKSTVNILLQNADK